MGTSASSRGPGYNVPLIPPWVDQEDGALDPPADNTVGNDQDNGSDNNDGNENGDGNSQDDQKPIDLPSPGPAAVLPQTSRLSPRGRFRSTRLNFGRFAGDGSRESLRKGLGHYSKSGLGGSRHAATRMSRTAKISGLLYTTLDSLRNRSLAPSGVNLDYQDLVGKSAKEIADRIANAISPSDGSQDAEANREAISQAFREVIKHQPDVDLTSLAPEQIESLIEYYVGFDICKRIELDVGKSIFDKTDAVTAMERLDEMRSYVMQCVASEFRKHGSVRSNVSANAISTTIKTIIFNTFEVFEEYIQ